MSLLQIFAVAGVVIWLAVAGRALIERDEKIMTALALANVLVLVWSAFLR